MTAMKEDNAALITLKKNNNQEKLRVHKLTDASSNSADGFVINKAKNGGPLNKKSLVNNEQHIKKAVSPGRVRKHKTTTSSTKSRTKSKKKDASESKVQRENKGSFYQGAIFGSFLGAAVTTVLSNLAVKALQN
ncbi:BFH_collapsed_G0054300.mRNA.1.CDS.1 [Saccharomyces cerevisiae]|nr:BFH_collapsed_G0054300.mRNA.1.CDS.1 [Saccharomyces cerevisiae]